MEDQISIKEKVKLALVKQGIKPAFTKVITGKYEILKDCTQARFITNDATYNDEYNRHKLHSFSEIDRLLTFLKQFGEVALIQKTTSKGNGACKKNNYTFHVARDKESLSRLNNASNFAETGLALGYPRSCALSYPMNFRHEVYSAVRQANEHNVQVPDWVPYVMHVPCKMDLVRGQVCDETRQQALGYMDHIKTKESDLATLLERDFNLAVKYMFR